MSVDQWTALIRDVGLPAIIVIWFLIRLEPRIDRLIEEMARFTATVQAHMTNPPVREAPKGE